MRLNQAVTERLKGAVGLESLWEEGAEMLVRIVGVADALTKQLAELQDLFTRHRIELCESID